MIRRDAAPRGDRSDSAAGPIRLRDAPRSRPAPVAPAAPPPRWPARVGGARPGAPGALRGPRCRREGRSAEAAGGTARPSPLPGVELLGPDRRREAAPLPVALL